MRLSLLISCVGAIGVFAAACRPISTQQPVVSPQFSAAQTCDHTSSGAAFVAAKVFKLSANFVPTSLSPPAPADIVGSVTQADPYWNDFVAAFTAAASSLKDKLCGLDGVFVVQNACPPTGCTADDVVRNSWGFRTPTTPPQRYIATSASLWQSGSAPAFVDFENLRLQALVDRLDPVNGPNWFKLVSSRPLFQSASPNTSTMTLLAILAHEYGHVFWYDAFVSPPGGAFNLNVSGFCPPNGFYTANAWGAGNQSISVPSPGRWVAFGQRFPTQIHSPDLSGALFTQLSRGNFAQAVTALSAIFLDRDLAATLASFTAIEDFVETYEWFQLISAMPPLTELTIKIGPLQPINVVQRITNKPGVRRKMACF
jgi:hypothetical protein